MKTKKISFDKNGYIEPYQPIEVDLDTLKFYFIDAFPESQRRMRLYGNYLKFLYSFQDNVFTYFEQWINGSFISKKKNPKDIDLVTFLDYNVYEKRGDEILDKYWKFSLEEAFIDSYIVKVYPENHPKYPIYQSERMLWLDRYGRDREDEPKGFLKLIFQK